MKIDDICHIEKYDESYWIGKVIETHEIESRLLVYIANCDKMDPQFKAKFVDEMKLIDGEYWEI